MKKLLFLTIGVVCFTTLAKGGGIITNTNQSASFTRMLVRDASTDIDAVYFNPAGLVRLQSGLHFSINSQTIFQSKDVTDDYQLLIPTPKKFLGDVKAPVFPGVYAAWKTGKWVVSFGFNPIGGGGGAEFAKGLPSFETRLADLVPNLLGLTTMVDVALTPDPPLGYGFNPGFSNVSGYNADIYFKGTSVFFGYQAGISYKINDLLGVYAGARFVAAKNTYKGYIRDVTISAAPVDGGVLYDIPPGDYAPGDYLRSIAGALGMPPAYAAQLTGYASAFDALAGDVEADAEEKGNGFTPILGANLSLGDRLNIGLKYEFKTKLDLTTTVHNDKDAYGMFVQDSVIHSDMPAMLSAGVGFKILPDLLVTAGLHYYFDKNANYGTKLLVEFDPVTNLPVDTSIVSNDKLMDKNYFEIGFGMEYNITERLLVSAGYLRAQSGVKEDYQSDLSYSLSSNTVALGLGYKITPSIMVNLGGMYSMYEEGKKDYIHIMENIGTPIPVTQTYYKDALAFGIGLDFRF